MTGLFLVLAMLTLPASRPVTSAAQPQFSVTVRWGNPKTPFDSNALAVWPIAGGATNWFYSAPTNEAVVVAPSNTVRMQVYTFAMIGGLPMLSLPSNTISNNMPPAQLLTNIYHVQPLFSPDLQGWTPQGVAWTFTNLTTRGSGFWRLALEP